MAASTDRYDDSSFQFRLITAAPKSTELTGAVDLLSYYGMKELHDKLCQKPSPVLIGENHYLKDVVGDIDIWKGEGMELGQLIGVANEAINMQFCQFDVAVLQRAFSLRESGPKYLPEIEHGVPTSTKKINDRKLLKHKDHYRDKDKHKDGVDHSRKRHKKVMSLSRKHVNAVFEMTF